MKTIAIYAGSFNPFTIGHLNILEKTIKIFENVVVAFGINPSKENCNVEGRLNDLKKSLKKMKIECDVISYTTFLHELIEKKEAEGYKVVLVRGLRNGDDLNYEDNQLKFIRDFKKDINVVFIRCDEEFEHVSSSAIRQLESFRPGSSEKYLVKL